MKNVQRFVCIAALDHRETVLSKFIRDHDADQPSSSTTSTGRFEAGLGSVSSILPVFTFATRSMGWPEI
ncbi:hypothetical protein [Bradyrhizobium sp. WSM471]|uniref:hypothetical protein n=1 Tax=Bradyrhizobium sp. WSM471 TaxID=319017 RepID=UPI0002D5F755|nr:MULTISPECIES: hypothetical protein [Bradyrhizobium]UFW44264.1 hypothetical protein BcanWSM471_14780 [Bradyrhizobium canariense]